MPLRSMTGFGQAESTVADGTSYRVEVRSVNNRFLDVQLRMPKSLSGLEQKTKQHIGSILSRGYVTTNVSHNGAETQARLTWDRQSVDSYVRIFREIAEAHGIKSDISLGDLLRFSDFIKAEGAECSEEKVWKELQPVLDTALRALQKSREDEGSHTETDLRKSLKALGAALKKVEARAPVRLKNYQKELRGRLAKLLGGSDGIDENRLAMEIAVMVDKLDISEECVRLTGHITAFEKAMGSDEAVGKQLGFLLQEMNREANTICSKANDASIAQWGVSMKEQLERIREQLQNIE
jgi:uncharacterized protein (TIGR00255 family)